MSATILLVATDVHRARAALSLALAQAALGPAPRLYAHERAVAMLARAPRDDDDSAGLAAAGLPDRLQLLAMAAESGIKLIACQTGLAITGLALADLVEGAEAGGLIGLLAAQGDAPLVVV